MSDQSGSDYKDKNRNKKSKKTKVQQCPQKRTRRGYRKNTQIQQQQHQLPQNIPITDNNQIITYHSYQLQITKQIMQVPLILFKSQKMKKIIYTKIDQNILEFRISNNQNQELIIDVKIKGDQQKNKGDKRDKRDRKDKGDKGDIKKQDRQQKQKQKQKSNRKYQDQTSTKNNNKQQYINQSGKKNNHKSSSTQKQQGTDRQNHKSSQNQPQKPQSQPPSQSSSQQYGQQQTFLFWGRTCWITNYQICTKTIKQSPKILNTQQYTQINRIKIKQPYSDIFIVLSIKKRIQTVSDYNGLINQGNTCYMNSYLQMLSHIIQFKNLVFQAPIVDQNKFPASLQVLFHKLDNDQKPVSAQQLIKSFGWTKKQVNIQQDAQEFSCLFFDVLERKLQQALPYPKHMSMSQIFKGNLLHIIQCLNIDFKSQNQQPFYNISLSISNSLQQSLDDYISQQILNQDNLYTTQIYGPQQAKKSVKFQTLPPVLMIQLKRFQFNYNTGRNQKILHKFSYPSQIDFSKWQVSYNGPCEYQLYAVLVHQGIKAQSGHYYVYIKINDDWYRFNDQQVSLASKHQVYEYNYGGEIDIVQFDSREFKIFNRRTVASSTAYMLVYVKKELKQQLLNSQATYPLWLKQHQIAKQGQRQQLRNRKNFYHDVQALNWQTNIKGTRADFIGLIPKNIQDIQGQIIGKLMKNEKIQQWIKSYNKNNIGVYLYLTSMQKIQYQTLINLQHRKSTFQQTIRDPNCQINLIFFPILAHVDSYIYIIKLLNIVDKLNQYGQPEKCIEIRFYDLLEISRNSRNIEILTKLKQKYIEDGYSYRFYYQQKKQLTQIKDDNMLIKGPPTIRNILGIIIMQKIPNSLVQVQQFINPTIQWYNDLKNFIEISIKSDDGKYSFTVQMDQNRSVQSLRQYIFQSKVRDDELYLSPENIVLKAKLKKTAKNYVEVTGAKTIKDLLKNCDKQMIIVFGHSKLKADQRINQVQIKFIYRFQDFSFSEAFHVILDRKSQNQSEDLYQKIVQHYQVQNFIKMQNLNGIRIFLFSKDKNCINDIVSESGHVHGKGQIIQVLQKQKGSHLVVQGFQNRKIEENMCPILLHHRTLNGQKIGIPRYLEFDRSTKLTNVYEDILQLIKDETYEWDEKKVKLNPMKVSLYAYGKDYNKGTYLADEETLRQFQIQEEQRLEKQRKKQEKQRLKQIQQNKLKEKQEKQKQQKQKEKQKINGKHEIEKQQNKVQELNKINQIQNKQQGETIKQKQQEYKINQNEVQRIVVISSQQSPPKSLKNQFLVPIANQIIQLSQSDGQNMEQNSGGEDHTLQNPSRVRKNSKAEKVQPIKLKSWQKTIENAFPKAKIIKLSVTHLNLSKAQSTMRINVQ